MMIHGEEHSISEIRSPAAIILRCTCGWVQQITRRQNALARAAKVHAAITEHEKSIRTPSVNQEYLDEIERLREEDSHGG
jgi:hypothetical protein